MKALFSWGASAFLLITLFSCKKEKITPQTNTTNTLELHFETLWGPNDDVFTLDTDLIHPTTGDTVHFVTLKYYVSNIKLVRPDGSKWSQNESYYLVDLSDNPDGMISIPNVPMGEYTGIEYTLGVDSLRNVSGAQTGALSTTNGMFWSWNSGYIFTKIEGTSPQAAGGSFSYHLGGFSGMNSIVTPKVVSFGATNLQVNSSNTPKIHFAARPETTWNSIGSLTSAPTVVHMPGANAVTIANDFFGSFVFKHVHN